MTIFEPLVVIISKSNNNVPFYSNNNVNDDDDEIVLLDDDEEEIVIADEEPQEAAPDGGGGDESSEIVIEDVTGCLVEPGNVEQLSQAIMRLNRDEQLYRKLISGVREHSFGFSSEYWHENFVNEIGDLVARRRRPSTQ